MPRTASKSDPDRSPKRVALAARQLKAAAQEPGGAQPLTARSVAALCGVELKTVHNWASEGLIPHFRTPGRHLRFQAQDVLRFLEGCGYDVPRRQGATEVVVVASKALLRKLASAWGGAHVETFNDGFEALIGMGRRPPTHVVLEAGAMTDVKLEAYATSVRTTFPRAKLAVIGRRSRVRGCVSLDASRVNDLREFLMP